MSTPHRKDLIRCPSYQCRSYYRQLLICWPDWCANDPRFKDIYDNCPPGHHVDHIVPINSTIVCGLHVPWNLEYLPAEHNVMKSNTFWPDCSVEQLELTFEFSRDIIQSSSNTTEEPNHENQPTER